MEQTKFEIRRAETLTPSLAEAFERLMPQLSARLAPPDTRLAERMLGSGSTALLAACTGERIVGLLALAWYDVPSGRKAWIEDLVVEERARRQGVGEALVKAALTHAEAVGAKQVMLTSNPARSEAHALYRKVGFDKAETTLFVRKTEDKNRR